MRSAKSELSVEVALWPGLTEFGLAAEAEIEKSVPTVFSSTLTVLSLLIVTRSGDLFPSRSEAAASPIALAGVKLTGA